MSDTSTTAIGFDLAQLDTPEAFTHSVPAMLDNEGEASVGFIIVGKDSAAYIATANRLRAAGMKRQAVKGQRIDTRTDDGAAQFVDLLSGNELDLAASVVVEWFGFTDAGQPAAFDAATARKALAARPTWRDKILAALEVEANFLPK